VATDEFDEWQVDYDAFISQLRGAKPGRGLWSPILVAQSKKYGTRFVVTEAHLQVFFVREWTGSARVIVESLDKTGVHSVKELALVCPGIPAAEYRWIVTIQPTDSPRGSYRQVKALAKSARFQFAIHLQPWMFEHVRLYIGEAATPAQPGDFSSTPHWVQARVRGSSPVWLFVEPGELPESELWRWAISKPYQLQQRAAIRATGLTPIEFLNKHGFIVGDRSVNDLIYGHLFGGIPRPSATPDPMDECPPDTRCGNLVSDSVFGEVPCRIRLYDNEMEAIDRDTSSAWNLADEWMRGGK